MKKFLLPLFLFLIVAGTGIIGCSTNTSTGASDGTSQVAAIDNSSLDAAVIKSNSATISSSPDDAHLRSSVSTPAEGSTYLIGAGIYDITGPSGEIVFMGFADDTQKGAGISMRLRSRAFVIGDGINRVVFVSADTWEISQMVKLKVAQKLAADPILSKFYSAKNVCLSATHTHTAVSGFDGYFLYDAIPKGFVRASFDAMVNGIYNSIVLAHNNIEPGRIYINKGDISKCGWNRSPRMYENNPDAERALYNGNTDKTMTLLKLVNLAGQDIGMINWYAVHPTSIGPENHLMSGDNKGHASYMFEKDMGTDYQASKTFVAAFAQTNAGDVTPNVPFTQHFGTVESAMDAAEIDHATAVALGLPWYQAYGEADIEQNIDLKLMAERQYNKAKELYNSAMEPLSGSIDFRHEWVDMRNLYVTAAGTTTCPGGMGASYSYGSPADNPSPFPLFKEGVTVDSIDWNKDFETAFLANFLPGAIGLIYPGSVTDEYRDCQAPKPVILATGLMSFSLKKIPLTPQIMPLQVLKIGSMAIAAVPTEVTTMSGRRIRKTVADGLQSAGVKYAVVASLANTYASYLATKEEFQLQGYEGGGTFFGPNQLLGFQQEYGKMCAAIVNGTPIADGTAPADITGDTVNFAGGGVVFDDKPLSVSFGSVYTQPAASYKKGDIVSAVFWGGHPNNNLMTQKTYLEIEKVNADGTTKVVARDWDPETKYIWQRDSVAYSKITIVWNTKNAEAGTYRIRHYGHWKSGWTGRISPYNGVTKKFTLL